LWRRALSLFALSPVILPAMAAKPTITIIGPGRLGTALALELRGAGYRIDEIVSRFIPNSDARKLARQVGARPVEASAARLDANLAWFCVPDREIARVAHAVSNRNWKGKIAFHSSGALSSDELQALRRRGAAAASVHPLMTFVRGSAPQLAATPFAVEGDRNAVAAAQRIISDLGGEAFPISKNKKAAYHAWGAFTSPLLIALLVTAEQVARIAGVPPSATRKRMLPILAQTLANYMKLGPAGAFSGPIVRGDAEIVRTHLEVLKKTPEARQVYAALARVALRHLPARNRKELDRVLGGK
jgi:predicted short-subunit dehydrogenase-like oxidoreductase (DUF2520 family)